MECGYQIFYTRMSHPITLQEQRKVWSIHRSVKGLTFYYNKATKKSQYQMPECFKTTQQTLQHPQWKQYKNADGKKFYYNAALRKSVWQLPNEVKQWRAKMEEQRRLQKLNQKANENDDMLNITDEQKKRFLALLKEKHINLNTKWEGCIKLCEDDERWKVIKISEQKKIFKDYLEELRRQDDLAKRAKLEVHKANFLKLLMEHKELTSDCKMHKMVDDFAPDPRWRTLQQTERQNVYQMYMDELLNKEKEEAKQKKKEHSEGLRALMEREHIGHRMKWDDFKHQYANNQHFKGLHPFDRLTKFTQYIIEQQKKYEDDQAKQKVLKEKRNRQNYRQLLQRRMKSGQINHKIRWVKFVKDNQYQKALLDMMDPNQQGSSAHQLFEDMMEDIRKEHKQFKGLIKQHFKQIGFRMSTDTTQQVFEERLQKLDMFWTLRPTTKDYFYYYFKNKIKSKTSKKSKKDKKVLFKIFKHLKDVRHKSTLQQYLPTINQQLKSHQLEHPIPQQTISKYFTQYFSQHDSDKKKRAREESRSDSDSSDDDRKKRLKKRKRSESKDQRPTKKLKHTDSKREDKKDQSKVQKKQVRESSYEGKDRQQKEKESKQGKQVPKPNDNEEQGQIKDEDLEDKHKSHSKKKKKKSRKRSDSSDS